MEPSEILLLRSCLAKAKSYYEFGCGGSTLLSCEYNQLETIISVDTSLEWINLTKEKVSDKRVQFVYIDINADPHNWGQPRDESMKDNWINYPLSIMEHRRYFDLILVDGRFRVACCGAASMRMSKDSILLLHDCDRYGNIPLIKVDQVGSLAAYRKGEQSDDMLLETISKHRCQYM